MLIQIVLLVSHSLLLSSCHDYVCQAPDPKVDKPDFEGFGFAQDVIDTVGECVENLERKPDTIKFLSNIWPAFGITTGQNCVGKGLTKIASTPFVRNIAKQISIIPVVGAPIATIFGMFDKDDSMDKLKTELKQEFRNLNESILCALGVLNDTIAKQIIESEDRLKTFIDTKLDAMMQDMKKELEFVREDIAVRINQVHVQLNSVISKLTNVIAKLEKIDEKLDNMQSQMEKIKFFQDVTMPLEALTKAYNLSIKYETEYFKTRFQEACKDKKPISIISAMMSIVDDEGINNILKLDGYSDDVYKNLVQSYYAATMQAAAMLYNCNPSVSYTDKQKEFNEFAPKITEALLRLYDDRKEKFWNLEILQVPVDKIIREKPRNADAAQEIYNTLITRYENLEYNFMVIVVTDMCYRDTPPEHTSRYIVLKYQITDPKLTPNDGPEHVRCVKILRNVKAEKYHICPYLETLKELPYLTANFFTREDVPLEDGQTEKLFMAQCHGSVEYFFGGSSTYNPPTEKSCPKGELLTQWLPFINQIEERRDTHWVSGEGFYTFGAMGYLSCRIYAVANWHAFMIPL